jgi:catechol 2,3-dioxygenase-like lactoylglutathione lyase family enzyme
VRVLRVGSVVLNVADVERAVGFWCAALDFAPVRAPAPDFAIIEAQDGSRSRISLNLSDQAAPNVPHVHLDLYAGDAADQEREVERLVGLGATRVDWPHYPGEEHDFVVLSDPDGNRFCVIDTGG